MGDKTAIVITTINAPTRAVQEIARDCHRLNAQLVLIGDNKTPLDFHQPGATYLDIDAQLATGFALAKLAHKKHYARKNIGYLIAIRGGADVIIETDDDNIPMDMFWQPRTRMIEAPLVTGRTWSNVYRHFSDALIWPRGLPLPVVRAEEPAYDSLNLVRVDCPIQQGLADGDPDVDAIFRLVLPLPVHFKAGRSVVLDRGTWCPFNSQNTTFFRDAFPLMYLPFNCSWRVTDIWRSLIAQRICFENGWHLSFHSPSVHQLRNDHDLMIDFAEEIPGYLNNASIQQGLEALTLSPGTTAIPANLMHCYRLLVEMKLLPGAELPLVEAWLTDVTRT